MAIIKMKHFTLIGLETERRAILDKLTEFGAVEAAAATGQTDSPSVSDRSLNNKMHEIELKLAEIKNCLNIFIPYDKRKKGLFSVRRELDIKSLEKTAQNGDEIYSVVERTLENSKRLSSCETEQNRLELKIQALLPWKDLPFAPEQTKTKNTVVVTGTIPDNISLDLLKEEYLNNGCGAFYIEETALSGRLRYIWAAFYRTEAQKGMEILKSKGFAAADFNGIKGTVPDNIDAMKERIAELEKEKNIIIDDIASSAEIYISRIENLHDCYAIELEKCRAVEGMIRTSNAFVLEGWVPERSEKQLVKLLSSGFTCHYESRYPADGDDVPLLLDNPRLIKPFEAVTEMYSLPAHNGIDPNIFMAPFFFIFFGIMLGDAAYGILLSIAAAYAVRRWGPQGMSGKVTRLMILCGISTAIWGALFGSWFGDLAKVISGGSFNIRPLWFNPMDDPVKMLILSFSLGGLHILTAMLLKAWMMIRDGDFMGAVYDIFSWIILLSGLVLLAFGGGAAAAGKYMAFAGALIIILFAGRSNKNLIKRIFSGLASLYSISGYLSDVLSYSRLLALGLATGVIASVVNTMGTMFGKSVFGIAALIILVMFGTVFNIALNVLGSYVHTSRLQYIEFFGKFYESGGRAFMPLGRSTRYINIVGTGNAEK